MKIFLAILALLLPVPTHAASYLLQRQGTHLARKGEPRVPFVLVGGNNYRAAGGPEATDCKQAYPGSVAQHEQALETLLSQMQADGLNTLRVWAFQSFAGASGTNYDGFTRLIKAAKRHHIRLIMVLENHWTGCSRGGVKSVDWYRTGYKRPYGGYALSLPDYADKLVRHFTNEATIAAWQLINEGESRDGQALFTFARDMSKRVKEADPTHLISLGTLACKQWGTDPANMERMHTLSHIDLVEAHDYGSERTPIPACIKANMDVAKKIGKPFFLGEVGVVTKFGDIMRGKLLADKIRAHKAAGSAGVLVWSLYDTGSEDGFAIPTTSQARRLIAAAAKDMARR